MFILMQLLEPKRKRQSRFSSNRMLEIVFNPLFLRIHGRSTKYFHPHAPQDNHRGLG